MQTIHGSNLVVGALLDGTGFEPCEDPVKTFEDGLDITASLMHDFGNAVLFIRSWALEPSSETDQDILVHVLFNSMKRPGFTHIGRQLANSLA